MEVKFEVRMNTKKMFHFLMYHIYHSFQGAFISVVCGGRNWSLYLDIR